MQKFNISLLILYYTVILINLILLPLRLYRILVIELLTELHIVKNHFQRNIFTQIKKRVNYLFLTHTKHNI